MEDRYLEEFIRTKNLLKGKNKKNDDKLVCDAKLDTFEVKKARDLILKFQKKGLTPQEKKSAMKIIKKMVNSTFKEFGTCYGYYILLGAEYADKIGEGDNSFIKKKLLEAYKKNPEMFDEKRVEDFFIKNNQKYSKLRGLARRLNFKTNYLFLLFILYLVLGSFFFSANLTGFLVLGDKFNYTGFLSGLFFILGIAGFFLHFRKKNS